MLVFGFMDCWLLSDWSELALAEFSSFVGFLSVDNVDNLIVASDFERSW